MNEAGKNIIQQLFGESDLQNVTRRDIEALTSRYPYFAPAQLLLGKKLKDTNGNGAEEQLQKAALYFTNPFWLNYLLQEESLALPADADEEMVRDADEAVDATHATADNDSPDAPVNEAILTEAPEITEEISTGTVLPAVTDPAAAELRPVETQETAAVNEPVTEEQIIPVQETAPEAEKIAATGQPVLDTAVPAGPEIAEEDTEDFPMPDEPVNEATDLAQRVKLSNLIEQHLADFKKPVQDDETLPIEPRSYHTIDYFASQGIRAEGQDNLSSRVRKFTDWLKQMKGANMQPSDLGTDAATEQMIETIAQTTNEAKDIVTEAMAEVLAKQGKTDKAIQLYKKLSFLNPGKSTYFAAKIEDLNKN